MSSGEEKTVEPLQPVRFVVVGCTGGILNYVKAFATEEEANADADRLAKEYKINVVCRNCVFPKESHSADGRCPDAESPGGLPLRGVLPATSWDPDEWHDDDNDVWVSKDDGSY